MKTIKVTIKGNSPLTEYRFPLLDTDEPIFNEAITKASQNFKANILDNILLTAPEWFLEFEIILADETIDHETIKQIITVAGNSLEIANIRPKFGRFTVTKFEVT